VSHSVGTPAATGLTPERGVLAAGAHDRLSRETSGGGPLDSAAPRRGAPPRSSAAGTPAGPATTRVSRAAAAPIVAPNSGPRAGGGNQPLVPLSGTELAPLNDLVISQLDGDNRLMSLPGLRKNKSRHLSWI
jgi:hypothetical protein